MSDRMWFIYGLVAPNSDQVRYIGMTYNMHNRLLQHISKARTGSHLPVHQWMASLDAAPGMVLLEDGVGSGWEEVEKRWIRNGADLLNVSEGGNMPAIPAESRKRAGVKLQTRIFTEEHRARLSNAQKGKPRSDAEAVAQRLRKVSANNKGKKMDLSDLERQRRRNSLNQLPNGGEWWHALSPEEKDLRRLKISEQMRQVWAQRKGMTG